MQGYLKTNFQSQYSKPYSYLLLSIPHQASHSCSLDRKDSLMTCRYLSIRINIFSSGFHFCLLFCSLLLLVAQVFTRSLHLSVWYTFWCFVPLFIPIFKNQYSKLYSRSFHFLFSEQFSCRCSISRIHSVSCWSRRLLPL